MRSLLTLILLAASVRAGEPGFREIFAAFDEAFPSGTQRRQLKQAAFERAAARQGLDNAIRAMRLFEPALEDLRRRMEKDHAAYLKAGDKWWAWRRAYERDHQRKLGRPPAEYPVPDGLNRGYIALELRFKEARSLLYRETLFQDWVMEQLAQRIPALDAKKRGSVLSALGTGLRDRNASQRMRCARLVARLTGPDAAKAIEAAIGQEGNPAVLATLLEARAGADAQTAAPELVSYALHADWPVRIGALHGLRAAGTAEAVERIVTLPAEGIVADDRADALRAWGAPADAEAWWGSAKAGWTPKPAPLAAGAPVPGAGGFSAFGIESGSRALILCIETTPGWELLRDEALRSIRSLPDGALFGVVVFGLETRAWRKRMERANGGTRDSAAKFLLGVEPDPFSDPREGLLEALDLADAGKNRPPAADTIFFACLRPPREVQLMQDRRPIHEPRHVALEAIRRNDTLGVRIHAFGPSGPGQAHWLQALTAPFHGTHKDFGG